jgi:hypothetical protein
MTIERIPQNWASNANFSSGPDTGTETKTDPGSQANGFIRGTIAAPQYLNFLVNETNAAARRALAVNALALRVLTNPGTLNDADPAMAATQVDPAGDPTGPVVLIKSGTSDVYQCYEGDPELVDLSGTVASVTSSIREAATNGTSARPRQEVLRSPRQEGNDGGRADDQPGVSVAAASRCRRARGGLPLDRGLKPLHAFVQVVRALVNASESDPHVALRDPQVAQLAQNQLVDLLTHHPPQRDTKPGNALRFRIHPTGQVIRTHAEAATYRNRLAW